MTAWCFAIRGIPTPSVTVKTIGRASGNADTMSATALRKASEAVAPSGTGDHGGRYHHIAVGCLEAPPAHYSPRGRGGGTVCSGYFGSSVKKSVARLLQTFAAGSRLELLFLSRAYTPPGNPS